MREIKFRVWYWYQKGSGGNPDGKTRAGYWQTDMDDCYINNEGQLFQDSNDTNECGCSDINFLENDEHDICLYIGLKDKNGKEIYEGDIVVDRDHYDFENKPPFTVEWGGPWKYCAFGITRKRPKPRFDNDTEYSWDELNDGGGWNNLEIIGDIYENPELLKK